MTSFNVQRLPEIKTFPSLVKYLRGELAGKALGVMEKLAITALVVTGDNNRLTVVIHLHDILKKGIA